MVMQMPNVMQNDSSPSNEATFNYLRAAFRVLHELSVRATGGGFVIHGLGGEGVDLHSSMTMPIRVTFDKDSEVEPDG